MDVDDFRSVSSYLGQLSVDGSDELRILHEQLTELQEHPAFKSLSALLRLDREQHARIMQAKGQTHAEMSWEAGYVRGSATPWAVLALVASTHKRVQLKLQAESRDGES